jgi:hypothetical protein
LAELRPTNGKKSGSEPLVSSAFWVGILIGGVLGGLVLLIA